MKTIYYFLEMIFSEPSLKNIFPQGCEWSLDSFVETLGWKNINVLRQAQESILAMPLPEFTSPSHSVPDIIQLLLDVFYHGKYSEDDYFTIDDAHEPATELLHGIEFATYAWHAGAPDEDIIGGLLHDIGRFYHEPNHANLYHHDDGYLLLKGLFGESAALFSLMHGYAKAMLYDIIPGYPDGMTRVSLKTLELQRGRMKNVTTYLNANYNEQERQFLTLKAMFLRVFDESSKYPLQPEFHLLTETYIRDLLVRVFDRKHLSVVDDFKTVSTQLALGLCLEEQ